MNHKSTINTNNPQGVREYPLHHIATTSVPDASSTHKKGLQTGPLGLVKGTAGGVLEIT